MLISHRYRLIFIKTYKTAGTSVEVYLSQHGGPTDMVTPILPPEAGHQPRHYQGRWNLLRELWAHPQPWRASWQAWRRRERFYNHLPAVLAQYRVPARVWQTYLKFTIERNPWDKTLSHYHMLNHRAGGTLSFDAYLSGSDFAHNAPQYLAPNGTLLVDRVLRYETLAADLGAVFAQCGVPWQGLLDIRAKGEYRTDRRPYREVYTPDQRDTVARLFAQEIALHGYTF